MSAPDSTAGPCAILYCKSASFALLGIWLCVLTIACESSPPGEANRDACALGTIRHCFGADDCRGEQTCGGQPATWGACICANALEPDSGMPAHLPAIGQACSDNGDCADSAFCLFPDSEALFGGGPPQGVCVADCTENAQACDAYQAAVCIPVSVGSEIVAVDAGATPPKADAGTSEQKRTALCFERCRIGDPADAAKCHGLAQIACDPLSSISHEERSNRGFCRPLCSHDDDCSGRHCDLRHGVCVTETTLPGPPQSSFGAACSLAAPDSPDAGAGEAVPGDACEGLCLQLAETYAICAHRCVFGDAHHCATATDSEPWGGCLFATPGGGLSDVGYCAELCDCTTDCRAPQAVCDPFEDAALEAVFGRRGVCTAPELALHDPVACAL